MSDNALWPFWLMAVAVHVLLAAYYFGTQQEKPIVLTGEGGTGIEVGLDQAAYQTLMQQQAEKARAMQQAQKPSKPVKQKLVKAKPQTPKPKKVVQQPVIKPAVQNIPLPSVTKSVVKPVAQKVAMITPAEQTSLSATQSSQTDAVNIVEHQQSTSSKTTNDQSSNKVAAINNAPEKAMGTPAPLVMNDATKRYIRKLMRHLSQFKEYPGALKKAHIEGTPVIRFTFNQAGEVLETTIKKRSNNKALDNAAMEVFKKANPLPPIPQALKRDTLTMSLPIKFNLIND